MAFLSQNHETRILLQNKQINNLTLIKCLHFVELFGTSKKQFFNLLSFCKTQKFVQKRFTNYDYLIFTLIMIS